MPEQFADHGQTLSRRHGRRRERVSQVMNADVLKTGARSHTLPERLEVAESHA